MIVDLDDLRDVLIYLAILDGHDPKLLRYNYNGIMLANESGLSNSEYGRTLIKFLSTPPQGKPS